ncbi:MAG: 23S rRNA (adenine(2503)-C(2))-methyltransferase RlmN [Candidatus Ornithospirochaeta sp.]|nr:23S rRNA (adenine(2503)-C(2))-methyltransferase RlmN [Candidatus Ornithospirochaeta sp.]
MRTLYCLKPEELQKELGLSKPFQARIVYQNLVKGIDSFSKMTSLPKDERARLEEEYPSVLSSRIEAVSESESAVKLAIRLHDGAVIECVRLTDGEGRHTACLSSQVGCAMGCAFCKTGTMGLTRDLEAGEIIEQLVHLLSLGERISHIVFMGMGEPLANFQEVARALTELHSRDAFDISYRKITISTCGLVPGIRRLTELDIPVKLAVSLVSADDETRSRIMKVNRAFPLSELKDALISFQRHQDKRITLEYCMLSGVNMDKESAEKLRKFTKGLDALVNLIPWNAIDELDFRSPSKEEIRSFTDCLDRLGVNYTIRRSKGRNINGACGQLASETVRRK